MTATAYDPNDSTQTKFLSALALGENSGGGAYTGVGGANLSSMSTDSYGFPLWQGVGNSHAAGIFQFEPGTWDDVAGKYGLNFGNPSDQAAGAWYLAQDTYAKNNNGASLEDALNSGKYSSVQSALSSIWPSVTGNAAAPEGLAADMQQGKGLDLTQSGVSSTSDSTTSSSTSIWDKIASFLTRFGLIIVGVLIAVLALYFILKKNDALPSVNDLT